MNSTPVILRTPTGEVVYGDLPVLTRTRARVVHMDPARLENIAVLPPQLNEELDLESLAQFLTEIDAVGQTHTIDLARWIDDRPAEPTAHDRLLALLDDWVTEHDDCPSLASFLDDVDTAGLTMSFDLMHWLDRWRRA